MPDPSPITAPSSRLVSLADARTSLGGVSPQTLYRLAADGDLRIVKVRRRSFVPASDIDAYIARSTRLGLRR
jgi:excisionase family DNA binding protein